MSDKTSEEKSAAASSGMGLTFPQIAASALAAATAAILGSFMGVLGTIGGAAVASIISTVGSALYQRSLEATRDRVKQKLVVTSAGNTRVAAAVGKVAGAAGPAAGQPSQPGPTRVQGGRPMVGPPTPGPGVPMPPPPQGRPGMPPVDPTRRVPTGPPTARPGQPGQTQVPPGRVALRAEGLADPTRVHPRMDPNADPNAAPTEVRPTFIPQSRQTGTPPGGGPTAVMGQPGRPGPGGPGGPPGPGGPDGPATRVAPVEPEPARPRFTMAGLKAGLKGLGWKTWLTLGGVAASVFVIALLATIGVETATGHPLSGGSGGTSVGSLFGQETGTSEATTTPAESSTDDQDTATTTQETEQQQAPSDGDTTTSQSTRSTTQPPRTSQNGVLPNLGGGSGGQGSGGGSTNG